MAADKTIEWYGKRVMAAYRKKIQSGMRVACRQVRDEVRAGLSGPAGSPAGAAPGKVDGDLIRAVKYKVKSSSKSIRGSVGVIDDFEQAAKGARLAGGFAGTDAAGRRYHQRPRPWLVPVVRRRAKEITRTIANGG